MPTTRRQFIATCALGSLALTLPASLVASGAPPKKTTRGTLNRVHGRPQSAGARLLDEYVAAYLRREKLQRGPWDPTEPFPEYEQLSSHMERFLGKRPQFLLDDPKHPGKLVVRWLGQFWTQKPYGIHEVMASSSDGFRLVGRLDLLGRVSLAPNPADNPRLRSYLTPFHFLSAIDSEKSTPVPYDGHARLDALSQDLNVEAVFERFELLSGDDFDEAIVALHSCYPPGQERRLRAAMKSNRAEWKEQRGLS